MTTGLPDQGFEDSDNSSIFSSPSPKSRQRTRASCLSNVVQNSSVPLRQRIPGDEDGCDAMIGVQMQTSHAPVIGINNASSSNATRPLSFVLSLPEETCSGELANSNNGQVLHSGNSFLTCYFLTVVTDYWLCLSKKWLR